MIEANLTLKDAKDILKIEKARKEIERGLGL